MAKPKASVVNIAEVYRADTIDKVLFGFVKGRLGCVEHFNHNNPSTIKACLEEFAEEFSISPDDWDLQSAQNAYWRFASKKAAIRKF